MKEIAAYYKQNVLPELRAVKVKTDGQRSQYKGQKNLGEVAEWPHPKLPVEDCKAVDCLCLPGEKACGTTFMKPGQDLELIHDFSCSHHGSGPVDSFSKDARHGMDSDVAAGKFVRYNYEHCYEWCIQNMAAPEGKKKHRGTFGANGNYFWRAYSDGNDANEKGFPVIPNDRSFQALPGSNEIYSWRGNHKFIPQLEALFVPCYCINCRSGRSAECKYRNITHSLVAGGVAEYFITHERPSSRREASDSD